MLSFCWSSFCSVHDAWCDFPNVGNVPALIIWKCPYLEEINRNVRFCLCIIPEDLPLSIHPTDQDYIPLSPQINHMFSYFPVRKFQQMCKIPLHNCKWSFFQPVFCFLPSADSCCFSSLSLFLYFIILHSSFLNLW